MYLLTAEQIVTLMSNSPNQGIISGIQNVSGYSSPLALIKTRCEELLEVESLDRRTVVDTFTFEGSGTRNRMLRLSNAFLATEPLLLTTFDDQATDYVLTVDREKGIVYGGVGSGTYKVAYTSGFAVDEDNFYIGVPDWLQSIAKLAYIVHLRLTSQAKVQDVNYAELHEAVRQDLYARVTKRWQRPRIGVTFPSWSESNGIS